jgi:hypothetical protein
VESDQVVDVGFADRQEAQVNAWSWTRRQASAVAPVADGPPHQADADRGDTASAILTPISA